MARGDRSRPERSSEERERDRAERERRRAERSGQAPAPPPPVEEPPPDEPTGGEPQVPLTPGEQDPAESDPLAADYVEPEPAGHVEEPQAGFDGETQEHSTAPFERPGEADPADAGAVHDPAAHQPPAEHEAVEYEQHLPAQEPEPAEESASYEPAPAEEPVSYEQGLPGHEPEAAAPAEEPVTYEHDQAAHDPQSAAHEPEPAELEPEEHEPEEHEAAEHEAAEPAPAGGAAEPESEDAAGHAIPGLAPVERTIPKPERLPPSPPRVGGREKPPMRRAFRRGAPAAGAPLVEPRRRRRRTVFTRLAAVVALAAVAVVVILIVHSLSGSGSSKAPAGPPVVKVLIPEGKTRLQIAQIAAAAGLTGDYRRETKHSPLLNPAHYGAPADTPDLEGFLFPATYDMDKGGPVGRLVEEQLTAFQENFGPETVARAKALGVTPYQLLTVASMVEREAQVPSDRAKIAAVIYNRLKAGMPLGIDASIYYAVEMAKGVPTYTHELTESQLHIDSPYNTRLHTGLPPTPISNPGTASIYAAAHPSHVGYLYYVAGADGCGEQVFSESQAKFEEDVAAYEAAKRANGGHPPACKHS